MKKVSLNFIFIILIISFVGSILFGALVRHHYIGGTKFKNLQKVAAFFAEIPHNIKFIITKKTLTGDVISPMSEQTYDDKKFFNKKLNSSRDELILISRHDGDLGRSIVEIRDLNTFEVLHSYLPDIQKIYEKTDLSKAEFRYLKRDLGLNRFYMCSISKFLLCSFTFWSLCCTITCTTFTFNNSWRWSALSYLDHD